MRSSSKSSFLAAYAIAMLGAGAFMQPPPIRRSSDRQRPQKLERDMTEIERWNAEVDRRKAEKKARKP